MAKQKKVKVNDKEYTLQSPGYRWYLETVENNTPRGKASPSQVNMIDDYLEHVVVDPDVTIEDFEDEEQNIKKANIEAKSRNSSLNMNPLRISRHISRTDAKYALVIAPRFSRGNKLDIQGLKVVTVAADTIAEYCLKGCMNNENGYADYDEIDKIIDNNLGQDITQNLKVLIDTRYGLSL